MLKEKVVASLGQQSLLMPAWVKAALLANDRLRLTGLVARADGSFLLRRSLDGPASDAAALGIELGRNLRADSPADLFA